MIAKNNIYKNVSNVIIFKNDKEMVYDKRVEN